ncbi:MAG: NAD-dependent deacetylase, partial [Planctomycetaceae bacterium]
HATISFGQSLPAEVLQEAVQWSRDADVFLAMGSSLVVEPAAGLPRIASENGAKLAILNRNATPLDAWADVIVNASLGETMTVLRDLVT